MTKLAKTLRPIRSIRPVGPIKRRIRTWLESRVPFNDHFTPTQRTLYILPTRAGLMLGITLLTLLITSINYQLNLGYLLTFLLTGSALAGMHVCHETLRGLTMNLIAPDDQFAGSNVAIEINLTNTRRSNRYAIGLRVLNLPATSPPQTGELPWVWTDVPAQGSSKVQVAFTFAQRGLHRLPTLTAETRFPLGTFRVWTIWRPAAQILIYPTPELNPPPLPIEEDQAQGSPTRKATQNTGEFDGIRSYRRGDPLKHVVWKKTAKTDEQGQGLGLVVRDAQQDQRPALWLSFMDTGLTNLEPQLSRLCAWVLLADQLALDYGLRLPALEIKPDSGDGHKQRCLQALALC